MWRKNLTLANSRWTVALLRERYGIEVEVLYPPAVNHFSARPSRERENGFVCLGRVVPEKRIDFVIEVLRMVRQSGHPVHLHIAGEIGGSAYERSIRELGRQHRDLIFLEGLVAGEEKKNLLAAHRFGISARENEPLRTYGTIKKVPLEMLHRPQGNPYTLDKFRRKWLPWARLLAKQVWQDPGQIARFGVQQASLEQYLSELRSRALLKTLWRPVFHFPWQMYKGMWRIGAVGIKIALMMALYSGTVHYYIFEYGRGRRTATSGPGRRSLKAG